MPDPRTVLAGSGYPGTTCDADSQSPGSNAGLAAVTCVTERVPEADLSVSSTSKNSFFVWPL